MSARTITFPTLGGVTIRSATSHPYIIAARSRRVDIIGGEAVVAWTTDPWIVGYARTAEAAAKRVHRTTGGSVVAAAASVPE